MLTKNINFKDFQYKKNNKKIKKDLKIFLREKTEICKSLSPRKLNEPLSRLCNITFS